MEQESIKLKYSYLDNKHVHQAIRTIAAQPLKGGMAYRVNKIIDALDGAIKTWQNKYELFVSQNAVMGEDGKPKPKVVTDAQGAETTQGVLMADEEKADKAFQAIYNEEFSISVQKIYVDEIFDVKLSADHLRAIAPFITEAD